MKVSELILELQDFMAAYGDREVLFAEYGSYDGTNLNGHNINDITPEEDTGKPVIVLWDK
ncbi:hypothetical protein DMN77_20765 [Paenibacillus sp. 79R4]|uniref:hypothetical protein n=1 Tax=Paenibacillus sp. 79R4 TaxID=2212847 RepID=UPI000F932A54|nr:hypothetical protein [Paenibacillus sp. 79R4]NWL89986.1 hypothetical protein [Paenibacillus sp. 79R4]